MHDLVGGAGDAARLISSVRESQYDCSVSNKDVKPQNKTRDREVLKNRPFKKKMLERIPLQHIIISMQAVSLRWLL
jgi:hypothetical protein